MKCFSCSRKINDLSFNQCKCQEFFCSNCLPFFNHNCTYDYKKDKKEKLSVENVVVVRQKVDHI